jgi:hypothetical protein
VQDERFPNDTPIRLTQRNHEAHLPLARPAAGIRSPDESMSNFTPGASDV